MKTFFFHFISYYLLSSCFIKSEKLRNLNKTNDENEENEFFQLIIESFRAIDEDCINDIYNDLNQGKNKKKETDKDYPWLIDYAGKALNELGEEIECHQSLNNAHYMIAKVNTIFYFYPRDVNLIKYLEVDNFAFGICITDKCQETFKKYFKRLLEIINIATNKNYNEDERNGDFVTFEGYEKNDYSYKEIIIFIFGLYLFIKVIAGIFRLIFIPKGYDKYVAGLLQEQGKLENIDLEEKKSFFQRNPSNEMIISEEFDYNSLYDLGSYFPIKLRIYRFFDLFNDVFLLTTNKNKYFNDNGLEVIIFMRSIVIFFLIFSGTFYALVSLPSKDIFNKSFFNSYLICIYKLSINSLTSWIVLEGAYTTYKLMNFIKTQLNLKKINKKKRAHEIELFIIFGKFILLFIPKIILFFIIYYFFYYNIEDFESLISSSITYKYIIKNIFKRDINCGSNFFDIFKYNFIFSNEIKEYNQCYEFTYIYFNIFFCNLIFMIILYLSFLFRSKIFEIFIILINSILFFISVWLIKDEKVHKEGEDLNYKYYHFTGQKYSTKILYSLIGFYHIGYILGFLLFHYDDNKYNKFKPINNTESKEVINKEINEKDDNIIESNDNNNNNNNINYYPLSFFNIFLSSLNNMKTLIKKLIIFICIVILVLFSLSFQIYLNYFNNKENEKENKYKNGNKMENESLEYTIELNTIIKLYFLYEKHIFIIFFFIINIILLSLSNDESLKSFMKAKIFIAISRVGSTIVCLYFSLIYLLFCSFYIKIKFHIPTFFLISIGYFLIIFIICFSINIIFELPLRKAVKNLLRSKNQK